MRTITKQVKADSFFNFFDPPTVPDDPNAEVDEDTQVRISYVCNLLIFNPNFIGFTNS